MSTKKEKTFLIFRQEEPKAKPKYEKYKVPITPGMTILEALFYIQDILDSIESIEEFVEGFDYDHFIADKKTKHAVIDCFNIIGEAVKNLP